MRPLNVEFHTKLKKRLLANDKAIRHLTGQGLTIETIEAIGLGLSMPYHGKKTDREYADALVYPLRGFEGTFYNKYGYYNIPGVTKNPQNNDCWMSGDPRSYYSSQVLGKKSIFVCQSPKELWLHWQAIHRSVHAGYMVLIASTHDSVLPTEWAAPSFWESWEVVYCGQPNDDAGEQAAVRLGTSIGRDARRVAPPRWCGRTWGDFWRGGGDLREFATLLRGASVVSIAVRSMTGQEDGPGRFPYEPISINGAFHGGHLYYTAKVLRREVDVVAVESGPPSRHMERLETVVIRSDRTVHTVMSPSAPKGTKVKDRVLRLTDGTLLDRIPQSSRHATWRWASICKYLRGESRPRSLGHILKDVTECLKAEIRLISDEDFAILTLIVPVTYAQAIFRSVPHVILSGPAGSGVRRAGHLLACACADAFVCGQSSLTSIMRSVDDACGLIVLNHLNRGDNQENRHAELVELLKLSCHRYTATRVWAGADTARARPLNLFGVKVVLSRDDRAGDDVTTGVLRIRTRKPSSRPKREIQALAGGVEIRMADLRDELHTWTFENATLIAQEYERHYPTGQTCEDNLIAPLKVMATLSRDEGLAARMKTALARRCNTVINLDDPAEVIRQALNPLILQGYTTISTTHLSLELRSMLTRQYGRAVSDQPPPWFKPGRLGRLLQKLEITSGDGTRARLWGTNLRFHTLRPSYVEKIRGGAGGVSGASVALPTDFCLECDDCQYKELSCEIMERRQASHNTPHGFPRPGKENV